MTRYNRDTERDTGDGDAASREPGEARTPGHPESDTGGGKCCSTATRSLSKQRSVTRGGERRVISENREQKLKKSESDARFLCQYRDTENSDSGLRGEWMLLLLIINIYCESIFQFL